MTFIRRACADRHEILSLRRRATRVPAPGPTPSSRHERANRASHRRPRHLQTNPRWTFDARPERSKGVATMSKSDPVYPASPELAEHAEAIRRLGKRILSDVVEIGERLTKARALIAHGTWLRWLEGELRWSDETARRFTDVYEMSKNHNLWDLRIPVSALYALARASEEIRDAVMRNATTAKGARSPMFGRSSRRARRQARSGPVYRSRRRQP